jgi:hypothetical protein
VVVELWVFEPDGKGSDSFEHPGLEEAIEEEGHRFVNNILY